MERPTLIIANRNYSSWSLRAWLALEATGQHFDEVVIPLGPDNTTDEIRRWSLTARVPALSPSRARSISCRARCRELTADSRSRSFNSSAASSPPAASAVSSSNRSAASHLRTPRRGFSGSGPVAG